MHSWEGTSTAAVGQPLCGFPDGAKSSDAAVIPEGAELIASPLAVATRGWAR
jgi:hypothetical protein